MYPAGGRCDVAGAPATVGTHGAPHLRHGHHTDVRLRGGSVPSTSTANRGPTNYGFGWCGHDVVRLSVVYVLRQLYR